MQNRIQNNRLLSYLLAIALMFCPMMLSAKTIMILGDSLSAGYGVSVQQGWVYLLQKRLDQ